MIRYFLEVAYKGTAYSGFQIQQNAMTVQSEVERAMEIFYRRKPELTGSSRTDSGVHAIQNYFHFDSELPVENRHIYNLNSLLPADIVIRRIIPVDSGAHSRFDALSRLYRYDIYSFKDPFKTDFAYYYPYVINQETVKSAATYIIGEHDFSSFSKRNTQVRNFRCRIIRSEWVFSEGLCSYYVQGNRFLRGMVRGLVGTMLRLSRAEGGLTEWKAIIDSGDCGKADFSVPGKGLWLERVEYAQDYFDEK